VSRLITAFSKIRAAPQFSDFEFNLKFGMTATALYIGQRVHKKSNKKRSELQWKERVNVPSINTTWKVLFSKLKLLKNKTQINELPLRTHAGKVGGIRFACGKDNKKSWLAPHCELLH